jgi:sugar phosphate permease
VLSVGRFTGSCQGAVVPLLFSLIGDYYATDERASVSAIVSSCLGGGMMLGQLFVGFSLSLLSWRIPFVVLGFFALFSACIVQSFLEDPVRGGGEDALTELLSTGVQLPRLTVSTFVSSMFVPTVAIMILQTVPNTVPWGVLSAHLHDFLATDANLSMERATSLIAVFGAGAAIGGLFGGLLGGKLYSSNRMLLPLFMGVTMSCSSILLKELLSMDLAMPGAINLAFPVLVLSGSLAAINGANIRTIVLNLTMPEARGATIAVLNFVNCIGRGVGPTLIEMWMNSRDVSRREAVSGFLNLWLFSGSFLCLACMTIARDEDKMKNKLKDFASANSKLLNKNNGIVVAGSDGSGLAHSHQHGSRIFLMDTVA